MSDFTCTSCGAEQDVIAMFAQVDDERALARLVALSIPLGTRVLQYVALFKPEKHRLSMAKKIKLITQLLPDLERKAITYKGRDWDAPLASWAQAIDQMTAARNVGRLELPMKGHGYLYAVLASMGNAIEAQAEKKREEERRTGPRPATTNGLANVADLVGAAPAAPKPAPRILPQSSPGTSPAVRAMREQSQRKAAGGIA